MSNPTTDTSPGTLIPASRKAAKAPIAISSFAQHTPVATTTDPIAPGWFGVNIVSGWAKGEYEQMNLWPGDAYFGYRYDYASEYVQVMKDLWETGVSDFKGCHFQMTDCNPVDGD